VLVTALRGAKGMAAIRVLRFPNTRLRRVGGRAMAIVFRGANPDNSPARFQIPLLKRTPISKTGNA